MTHILLFKMLTAERMWISAWGRPRQKLYELGPRSRTTQYYSPSEYLLQMGLFVRSKQT